MQYEKRPGLVISSSQGTARVQMECGYACPRKETGCPCGTFLIDVPSDQFIIEASDSIGVRPGQIVEVAFSSKQLLRGVFIVFVVPLIGLFLGYLVGLGVAHLFRLANEARVIEAISAVLGFGVSLFVTIRLSRSYNPKYTITGIIAKNFSGYSKGGKNGF